MPEPCVINTDNLQTIARERRRSRMITLREEHIFALANALRHSLDLEW
jgi:mRNA-degrading endonuclease toxin of MazEF toxin-antitoxin module